MPSAVSRVRDGTWRGKVVAMRSKGMLSADQAVSGASRVLPAPGPVMALLPGGPR